jgi:hypothetical protein
MFSCALFGLGLVMEYGVVVLVVIICSHFCLGTELIGE